MKRIFLLIWNNKQAITGAVTGAVSLAAGANMMTAEMAVKITAGTGILTLALGLFHTLFVAKAPTTQPTQEPQS